MNFLDTQLALKKLFQAAIEQVQEPWRGYLLELADAEKGWSDLAVSRLAGQLFHGNREAAFSFVDNAGPLMKNANYSQYIVALFARYELMPPESWREGFRAGLQIMRQLPDNIPVSSLDRTELLVSKQLTIIGDEGLGDQVRRLWYLDQLPDGSAVNLLLHPKIRPLITQLPDRWSLLQDISADRSPHKEQLLTLGGLEALLWSPNKTWVPFTGLSSRQAVSQRVSKYLRLGVCFRSVNRSLARSLHYMVVEDLSPILRDSRFMPVILQPGMSAEEKNAIDVLTEGRAEFVDHETLFNDMGALCERMQSLDVVVSPSSYIADLAAAIGVRTVRFQTGAGAASETRCSAWYGPHTYCFFRRTPHTWEPLVEDLHTYLGDLGANI